ncbi:uncharacterized protein LOC126847024 isoform X2 [Adelges cooleyi]|uniref:uncharacterized protein LOC126847024 isoform X2 n=1 Tax=Adelges cooleyi TaxID=133065 RepID=UPI00217F7AFA|nr:uncharacterized protein LOC126847024 isoform X2 [Adelges cooleyi]
MTNNKLHVFCLFVLTICIVINNTICAKTEEDCIHLISRNSYRFFKLNDEGLIGIIHPPDIELLGVLNENELASEYQKIYDREMTIRAELIRISNVLNYEFPPDKTYAIEIKARRNIFNSTFRYVLHDRLKDAQMCVNDEGKKCLLVGLIKRTLNYRLINKQECTDDGNCVVTSHQFLTNLSGLPDRRMLYMEPPAVEIYRDQLDTNGSCYKTLFSGPDGVLIPWTDNTQVESSSSDDE